MAYDIRSVRNITDLIGYFSENLNWAIDIDDFDDIEDISYDFEAEDIGLKEENFAKISSLRQLQPLVDGQQWGIFCIEFDSNKFEVSALRKILSKFVPKRRSMIDHAVWEQQDLLFICNWGEDNNRTIGIAHFEDQEKGLPQIKMISCAPALEDFTQIKVFEDRLAQLAWPKNTSNIDAWREAWSNAFASGYRQTIQDSSTLTIQLAAEAQNIRNRILSILDVETKNGYVHLLYDKFKDTLIHDMTEQQFADMYAQTVVYGLFSARCMDSTQDDFSAAEAIDCIPSTNPFLKSLMRECLGSQGSNKLSFDELEIGNVVDLLLHTKTDEIIKDFNRQTGGGREDPVIHFYEEFLTAYDKSQKVQRGVYYTPQPVVNFIVRAVDSILKTEFGYEDGLASTDTKKIKVLRDSKRRVNGYTTKVEEQIEVPAVQILDPATGTGTFLRQTILQIYDNFQQKHKGEPKATVSALWNKYVDENLLPRLNGFELMMAPYAVAHMKLAMVLKDTGYDFSGEHRLNVFLTNSLEKAGNSDNQLTLFDDPLAVESIEANKVKKNTGISVIIGNPPYAGESANKGPWIMELMEDYKKEPGGKIKLQERNPKWINDDYVKFIRYAQKVILESGNGILAYICPHGFIDNPTFRGMRWFLLSNFGRLYILNLHGNIKKKETCPDGSKDENVFDIQQGVCIVFAIKNNNKTKLADVYYEDLYGLRDVKYNYLLNSDLSEVNYRQVFPTEPQFFMTPKDLSLQDEYNAFIGLTELMPVNSVGVVTGRDGLNVSFTEEEQISKMKELVDLDEENARDHFSLGKDVRDWHVEWAQKDARSIIENVNDYIKPYLYRPFDVRYTCFTGTTKGLYCYPRLDVMRNYTKPNVGIIYKRGFDVLSAAPAFVSNHISDFRSWSCPGMQGGDYSAPLYVYTDGIMGLQKRPNFDEGKIKVFEQVLGMKFSSEESDFEKGVFSALDVFDYIYAVMNSRKYHEKYVEFIKTDFPRVPTPRTKHTFELLCPLGAKLRELHLMNAYVPTEKTNFIGNGNSVVEKFEFKNDAIYINKTQYFSGVSADIWNYYIGGYQPLQKWLKDRKKMMLDSAAIQHYKYMIGVISMTIDITREIDAVVEV